jgi:hypothetical protein
VSQSGPKRTRFQRERDYVAIARLYLQGAAQAEMATILNLSPAQVCRDLQVVENRWRAATVLNMDAAKARELAKIDELERTYWQAWLESKTERQITSTKRKGKDSEAMLRRERRDGNPAFLDGVMKCIERRCRLLGIDAPVRQEHTGKDGGPIAVDDVMGLSTQERVLRIAAILDAARLRAELPSGHGGEDADGASE